MGRTKACAKDAGEHVAQENIWKTWTNSKKSDLVHDFTMRNYDRAKKVRNYGVGTNCTPVEAHLLEKIYENPDSTVTQLAQRVDRSKAAVSQIVTKLEEKGLLTKTPRVDHAKKLCLRVTAKGERLTLAHIAYDEKVAGAFFRKLAKSFDDETMGNFFCVLRKFLENMNPSEGYKD